MLTWATWLLSQHPDAQRKMQDEIDVVLQGRRPTFEDMKKLEQVCITVCLCAHVFMCLCAHLFMCVCAHVFMCLCAHVFMCLCAPL